MAGTFVYDWTYWFFNLLLNILPYRSAIENKSSENKNFRRSSITFAISGYLFYNYVY